MLRRVPPFAALAVVLLPLAGCSDFGRARRPAWRTQAENACVAEHLIHTSSYVEPEHPIDGPGICGLTQPFRITALLDGQVTLNGHYTLDCPMVASLNNWVRDVVEPDAQARFNERVVEIMSMGSYSCRGINNVAGARLSEHSFGNAIDISGFRLADGRVISVVRDWSHGDPAAQAFLRDVDGGACGYFTTVLGPGYNALHYNHIHVDLAMRGNTSTGPRRICHPRPHMAPLPEHAPDGLPEPPPLDEEMDISQAGTGNEQSVALRGPGGGIDGSVPPPAPALPHNGLPVPGSAYRPYHPAEQTASDYRPYRPAQQQTAPAYQPYHHVQRTASAYGLVPPGDVGGYSPRRTSMSRTNPAREGRPPDWDLTSAQR